MIVVLVLLVATAAAAGETSTGTRVKRTVKEAANTGGYPARDGALTFGRSTRDFFKGGPGAARRTWKANAAHTKATAKAGGRATRDAANGK